MNLSPWVNALLAVAGALTAVGVVWRFLHLGELLKGTRLFLVDWLGTPERPGAAAVPGFPARMAKVEQRTADLAHDFRGELTSRLTLLAFTVDQLHADSKDAILERNRFLAQLAELSKRVSDHRHRNDEQIALLREAVARNELRLEEVRLRSQHTRATDHLRKDPDE